MNVALYSGVHSSSQYYIPGTGFLEPSIAQKKHIFFSALILRHQCPAWLWFGFNVGGGEVRLPSGSAYSERIVIFSRVCVCCCVEESAGAWSVETKSKRSMKTIQEETAERPNHVCMRDICMLLESFSSESFFPIISTFFSRKVSIFPYFPVFFPK